MTAARTTAWPQRRLGELVELTSGQSPSGFKFGSTGKPYFKVDQLGKSAKYLGRDSTPYLSNRLPEVPAGSILIAKRGAAIALNRVRLLTEPGFMDTNVMALTPISGIDSEFLYYWLAYRGLWDVADVTSVPQINNKHINPLRIALPDLHEQRTIVAALRDSDDVITAIERLIAKKQAIKQGMMQQLLTGRTRLPGFAGDWRATHLGDLLTVRHGKNQRSVEVTSGKYPILATGGRIGWAHTPLYSKPSVLIGRKGTIDRPQYQDQPFWTVDTLFYTEISAAADPRFLYYLFLTVDWRSMNEASGVPSLSSSRIEGVEAQMPDVPEQIAIRKVLDDAEREIAALGARLSKARDIKTGMMQQLLTGRVRLPGEAAS
jgi:type I restriction enzyme S subunit